MANEWYSIAELVEMNLPELSGTVRGINKCAKRDGWRSRPRQGKGGGLEYHLSALPLPAQAALLQAESRQFLAENPLPVVIRPEPAPIDPAIKAAGDAMAAHLTGKPLARMNARLAVLSAFDQYVAAHPQPRTHHLQKRDGLLIKQAFCAAWNAGQIEAPAAVRAQLLRLTDDGLNRWRKVLRRAGLAAVAGGYGNRRGQTLIDQQPELAVALRALIVDQPHATAVFAHEFLCARYAPLPSPCADALPSPTGAGGEGGFQLPSVRTVERWLNAWKAEHHSLWCSLTDPDRWKNEYMVAWGDASAHVIRLNQEWQADSSPSDVGLSDGRHSLIALIDVYSRCVKLHVSKTSTAAAITHVLRRGLLDWGVPEVLKTDNDRNRCGIVVLVAIGDPEIRSGVDVVAAGFRTALGGGSDPERARLSVRRG